MQLVAPVTHGKLLHQVLAVRLLAGSDLLERI
jgi:hypothetical protein